MEKNNKDKPAPIETLPEGNDGSLDQQDSMDLAESSANVPLAFLEAEVKRLQSRWSGIECEVRGRDQRIQQLKIQVNARDIIAANLNERLEESKRIEDLLGEQILELECSISEYKLSQAERDVQLSEKQQELHSLEEAGNELQRALGAATQEVAALHKQIAAQLEAAAETDQQHKDLLQVSDGLRQQLQDLQLYVEGRTQHWAAKEQELRDQKNTISGIETVVKERDAELRAADKLTEKLSRKVSDLEGCNAELDGRRLEREAAYRDLEERMAVQTKETAELRADLGRRIQQADAAIDRAAADEQTRVSLQRGIERRDQSIAELEETLQQLRDDYDKSQRDLRKQITQVEELERGIEERLATNQELRNALKAAHEDVEDAQSETRDGANQIAMLDEAAEQLQAELAKVRKELDWLSEEHRVVLDRADQAAERANGLDTTAKTLIAERDTLQAELGTQQELVQVLESDLQGKSETLDVLDRSVDRIHELGMSIQELDHDLSDFENRVQPADDVDQLELNSGSKLQANAEAETADTSASNRVRRLVVALSGEMGVKYPLYKPKMTIGRSRRSDIQVQSKFISRIHARIVEKEEGVVIEDTGSKNGVTVNATHISGNRQLLHDGDTICLGEHTFKYVERPRV